MYVYFSILICIVFLVSLFWFTGMFSSWFYKIKSYKTHLLYRQRAFVKINGNLFMMLEDCIGEGQKKIIDGFEIYRLTNEEYRTFKKFENDAERREFVRHFGLEATLYIDKESRELFDNCYIYGIRCKECIEFISTSKII